jgi:hypothetical protein
MSDQQTSIKDRLEEIRSCLPGLQAGTPEPFFVTDVEWLISEVERLRADLARARATLVDFADPDHWIQNAGGRWVWRGDYPPFERPAADVLEFDAHQQEPGAGQS